VSWTIDAAVAAQSFVRLSSGYGADSLGGVIRFAAATSPGTKQWMFPLSVLTNSRPFATARPLAFPSTFPVQNFLPVSELNMDNHEIFGPNDTLIDPAFISDL